MAAQDDVARLAAAVADAATAAAAAQTQAEQTLKRLQEMRRLLGDPRVRVEVPTVKVLGESARVPPMSRRYHVG